MFSREYMIIRGFRGLGFRGLGGFRALGLELSLVLDFRSLESQFCHKQGLQDAAAPFGAVEQLLSSSFGLGFRAVSDLKVAESLCRNIGVPATQVSRLFFHTSRLLNTR